MSLVFESPLGRSRVDLRTGVTTFEGEPPLSFTAKAALATTAAAAAWLALQGAIYTHALARRRRLQAVSDAHSADVLDRASVLSLLASSGAFGGFLPSAHIRAAERDLQDAGIVRFFASGGWAHAEHVLAGLPLYPTSEVGWRGALRRLRNLVSSFTSAASDRELAEERAHWWTALTLGKSTSLNGALAFLVAMILMDQDRSSKKAASAKPLTLAGRKVINVGLCTGTLYSDLARMPLPSGQSWPLTTRHEVSCEIGTVLPELVQRFREQAGPFSSGEPDLRSGGDLARVCRFGTMAVLAAYRSTGRLPKPGSLPNVLWECKAIVLPPTAPHRWLWIEVEGGERFTLDAAVYFERGLQGRWRDDLSSPEPADAAPSSWLHRATSALSSLPSSLASCVRSLLRLEVPLSRMPRVQMLTSAQLALLGGASVFSEVSGPRAVVRALQDAVLINSQPPNAGHTQMRALLKQALQLARLPTKYLLHRLEVEPAEAVDSASAAHQSSASSASSSASGAWGASAYRPASSSKPRSTRSAKSRRGRKEAQTRADEEPSDQEDEGVGQHAFSPELDQVD